MIFTVEYIQGLTEFQSLDETEIQFKLDALESFIRKYTNNNFQNRAVRFTAYLSDNVIYGTSPYLSEGDTVQISNSDVNNGLYVIESVESDYMTIDGDLYADTDAIITKIEYPADIKAGALKLLKWDIESSNRVGIKSESISRHSVTYFDQDKNNQVDGYPISLLGFLEPYKKARFK